jgi:hypothetical protein
MFRIAAATLYPRTLSVGVWHLLHTASGATPSSLFVAAMIS